jgi:hypothetical protein
MHTDIEDLQAVPSHRIKAWLRPNKFIGNQDEYSARVVSEKSVIPVSTMEQSANHLFREMARLLCDGYSVNTKWFGVRPRIKGVFSNLEEPFNKDKHSISFDFHQGSLMRKELANLKVEIMGETDNPFYVSQVQDVKTGTFNDILTPNRNLKIWGSRIKLAGDSDAVGVYFVNQDSQERIKVVPADVVYNNPSEVAIVIPAQPAGTYKAEITTQFSNGQQLLKEPRTAVYEQILTVL